MTMKNGTEVYIDDADWLTLAKYNWWMSPQGYVVRTGMKNGKRTSIFMHKEIMKCRGRVDHISGVKCNNQRYNLRQVTNQQNSWNQRKRIGKHTSVFKGVYWSKAAKKWTCQVKRDYKAIYIGVFDTERAAAMAYDLWAGDLFGPYAKTNFIEAGRG